jgi:hypothetical protein
VIPAQADIDAALDVLDWLDLPTIVELRGIVSRLVRETQSRRQAAPARAAQLDNAWTPAERALLYVLWITSDEYLSARMADSTQ